MGESVSCRPRILSKVQGRKKYMVHVEKVQPLT
jgi:hypothetical protein